MLCSILILLSCDSWHFIETFNKRQFDSREKNHKLLCLKRILP